MATNAHPTMSRTSTTPSQDGGDSAEQGKPTPRTDRVAHAKAPRKKRVWLRVLIPVVVLLALIGALVGVFAWDRWYRYDDAADLQGRWYPAGSLTAVEIGPDKIAFDADTSYDYTIDTNEKTIAYSLGPLQGKGHYWFADGRSTLVIEDGEDFTARSAAFEDLGRMMSNLGAALSGDAVALPEGDAVSTFTREIDPAVVIAKEEAESKAREEEAAKRKAEKDAEAEKAAAAEEEQVEADEGDDASTDADINDTEAETDETATEKTDEKTDEKSQEFSNESMGIL